MNYHDIDVGKEIPESFQAVIEIPRESRNKYEIEGELLILDRVLHSSLSYPTNYGFIPKTHAKDGDALDILVWSRYPLHPRCIVTARPLGVLKMKDEQGEDNKVLAVPVNDPFFEETLEIQDVQEGFLKEITQFFKRYKELEEGKATEVKGWFGGEVAKENIVEAMERYKNMH
ncbi:MAG: inorganic pyrophosphatase [Candidatus Lokiarchaeota archaeon]|nr:inorganic pyrophosphatase [Candidatus Lokiarchaeota archaeon]MBD3201888.1 inorganic pyrophosphatase [Candidatus Lokiarchaeota archaeon]